MTWTSTKGRTCRRSRLRRTPGNITGFRRAPQANSDSVEGELRSRIASTPNLQFPTPKPDGSKQFGEKPREQLARNDFHPAAANITLGVGSWRLGVGSLFS